MWFSWASTRNESNSFDLSKKHERIFESNPANETQEFVTIQNGLIMNNERIKLFTITNKKKKRKNLKTDGDKRYEHEQGNDKQDNDVH